MSLSMDAPNYAYIADISNETNIRIIQAFDSKQMKKLRSRFLSQTVIKLLLKLKSDLDSITKRSLSSGMPPQLAIVLQLSFHLLEVVIFSMLLSVKADSRSLKIFRM
jgi:hypothetical protein